MGGRNLTSLALQATCRSVRRTPRDARLSSSSNDYVVGCRLPSPGTTLESPARTATPQELVIVSTSLCLEARLAWQKYLVRF